MEKFEIKQSHENKDIEKDIRSILEHEKEFSSWEEKVNYIKLYFLEKKFPEKLKMFFENQSFQKTYFETIYKKNDLVYVVQLMHKIDLDDRNRESEREQENTPMYFGRISFDGKSIHVNKEKKENNSQLTLEASFSLLAEYLSKLEIVPSRILAKSWLMGNEALRKRIGFEKIKKYDFDPVFQRSELWGQFVDDDGNIKRKELEYLFKNNEPHYKLTKAEISFENFMQKYGNQFLDREFTMEYDFSDEQEEILEKNKRILDNYFAKNFNNGNWFNGFLKIARNLPLYDTILKTDKGELFLNKISELEKRASSLDELKIELGKIKNDLDFSNFFTEKKEEFLRSKNKIEKVFIPKKP